MAEKKVDKKNEKKEKDGSKNSKAIMAILFLLGLIVLGGAAFGGVYLFMQTRDRVQAKPVVVENTYVDLGEFTVNLADEGGKRFFKGQISIGYDKKNKKLAEEITNDTVVLKDVVNFYIKSQKADFINNPQNENEVKEKLIDNINKEMTQGKVDDIRFNSILIQ